ncbi:hypothetical protein ACVOMT_09765 [Sphingomonas panni]
MRTIDEIGSAFLAQGMAQEPDHAVVMPVGEVQQHAVRPEIGDSRRVQRIDQRAWPPGEQRHPVIIGTDMHPPLVGAHDHDVTADPFAIVVPARLLVRSAHDVHNPSPWAICPMGSGCGPIRVNVR